MGIAAALVAPLVAPLVAALVAALVVCDAGEAHAQVVPPVSPVRATTASRERAPFVLDRCDSVVIAARVDSVPVGIFVAARRLGGVGLDPRHAEIIQAYFTSGFVAPKPFRLNVFSGPPRTRGLRQMTGDSVPRLRAPTLRGVYRFTAKAGGRVSNARTVRSSLMPGFDSAAVSSIQDAAAATPALAPPEGDDSMSVEIWVATDSTPGARRMLSAYFPRMPVSDAVPREGNPSAEFPEAAKADSIFSGEVVLRFVIDREGVPLLQTLEVVRATSAPFISAAVAALPAQRFQPASINGCAMAQSVEYPFTFALPLPDRPPPPPLRD